MQNPFPLAEDTSEWNKKKFLSYNREFWSNACTLFIKLLRVFSLWEAPLTNNQTELTCYWLDKQIISHLYCYTFCEFIFCSSTNLHPSWADNRFPLFLFCWLTLKAECEGGALVSLETINIYREPCLHLWKRCWTIRFYLDHDFSALLGRP